MAIRVERAMNATVLLISKPFGLYVANGSRSMTGLTCLDGRNYSWGATGFFTLPAAVIVAVKGAAVLEKIGEVLRGVTFVALFCLLHDCSWVLL